VFHMDTTQYPNGVHSIAWTVSDDAGNSAGIGSRYFTVTNTGSSTPAAETENRRSWLKEALFAPGPILVKRGFAKSAGRMIYPGPKGTEEPVKMKGTDRLELQLAPTGGLVNGFTGRLMAAGRCHPLPTGSTLDTVKGIFYWQPGPAFLGSYRLLFFWKDNTGIVRKKYISLHVSL
ncbi:MAG: hypothetical protein GY757_44000, partial [bacterium]|nr:hypothetical protein [bacterium]